MNRRIFLGKLAAIATIMCGKNPISKAQEVPQTQIFEDCTFYGANNPRLMSALKAENVLFERCKFFNCGTINFVDTKNITIKNCYFENTKLKIVKAVLGIHSCRFDKITDGYYIDLPQYKNKRNYYTGCISNCAFDASRGDTLQLPTHFGG